MEADVDPTNAATPIPQTNDSPQNLEVQKFELEKDKLTFERVKFEAEQAKRERELQKLDEEIREFKLPLWRKSSSIGAIATICVAVVAGFLTFGTDVFKSNIRSLVSDRSNLQKAVAKLVKEEHTITANNLVLEQQKDLLTQEKESLVENQIKLVYQRDNLVHSTSSLRAEKEKLGEDVLLAPIRTRLALIEPAGQFSFSLQANTPSDESIRSLTEAATVHKNDSEVMALFQDAFDKSQQNTVRAAIALILYRATGLIKWKTALNKAAIDGVDPNGFSGVYLVYYLHLLDSPDVFSGTEKTEILRSLYLKISRIPSEGREDAGEAQKSDELNSLEKQIASNQRKSVQYMVCDLAKWNRDATVAFREPWFACRDGLLKKLPTDLVNEREDRFFNVDLYSFSPEIFGVAVLQTASTLGTQGFDDGQVVATQYIGRREGTCPSFELSFPLCVDWAYHKPSNLEEGDAQFRLWYKSLPLYGEWLQANSQLRLALLDPKHKFLSTANAGIMQKLFDGVWITQADIASVSSK
jgi:hypothetical protein